jgi:hypothetical protein
MHGPGTSVTADEIAHWWGAMMKRPGFHDVEIAWVRNIGQPNMIRQTFGAPGVLFVREKARDEVLVMFKMGPALPFHPADGELERHAGGFKQNRHERQIDCHGLSDELPGRMPVEVIEQRREGALRIDAIL